MNRRKLLLFAAMIPVVTLAKNIVEPIETVSIHGTRTVSNGLKTIYARLDRVSVQNTLQDIGVQIKNSNGYTRPKILILKDLSKSFETLSALQKSYISEQVAGAYQVSVLQSILKAF